MGRLQIICWLVSCLLLLSGCQKNTPENINILEVQMAIDRGIEYLRVKQEDDGSFNGYYFNWSNPQERYVENPLGYTVYSSWNLQPLKSDQRVKSILENSLDFIKKQGVVQDGIWYWQWRDTLPFDLDDTVLSELLLADDEVQIDIDSFPHEGDQYKTWYQAWYDNELEPYDDVVNVNVLAYLVKNNWNYQEKLDGLLDKFLNDKVKSYYYVYADYAFLYHLVNIESLRSQIDTKDFREKVSELVRKNKGNELMKNIYLGYVLDQIGYGKEEVNKLVRDVLAAQNNDGSWRMERTFCATYNSGGGRLYAWGSKELTTSYAIKMLYSYIELDWRGADEGDRSNDHK